MKRPAKTSGPKDYRSAFCVSRLCTKLRYLRQKLVALPLEIRSRLFTYFHSVNAVFLCLVITNEMKERHRKFTDNPNTDILPSEARSSAYQRIWSKTPQCVLPNSVLFPCTYWIGWQLLTSGLKLLTYVLMFTYQRGLKFPLSLIFSRAGLLSCMNESL